MALLKMSRCLNRPTVGISRLRKQAQNKKKERDSFPRKGTRLGMWLKSDEKTCQSRGDQVEDFLQFEKITTSGAERLLIWGGKRAERKNLARDRATLCF